METIAYIALGSNVGDRRQTLDAAITRLSESPSVRVRAVSSYHTTAPVGGPPGQGDYLNAVAEVATSLSPRELLERLRKIESEMGRVRDERNGPRTLDLDLLLYGLECIDQHAPDGDLVIPHPRMHQRTFVLKPLAEIAPLAAHPIFQATVAQLLRSLEHAEDVVARDLVGKKAVVTGSTSGIGLAIVLELAAAGADIVVHGRRSESAALEVVRQCKDFGVEANHVMADLRNPSERSRLMDTCWGEGVDVWINNAGADTLTGEAARWTFDRKLEELWNVDVQATVDLGRSVGERMKARGRGVIVNMGWDQAETGMEGDSGQLFGTVKGAIMCFSKSLALSLAPQVRVHCVAPGWIQTAWGEQASSVWQERVRRETPLKRWGLPADIAKAVHWLVAPASNYVTGQILRVNGGAVRG